MPSGSPRLRQLHPDMLVENAVEIMLRAACDRVEGGWQKLLHDDGPNGPHELRVGLRKLRVALHILRDKQNEAATTALRKSLLSTGRTVGRLRDLDVLIDGLVAPLQLIAPDIGIAALIADLEAERAVVRAEVRQRLAGGTAKSLRTTLANLPADLVARLPADLKAERASKLGRRDLRRRWRKIAVQAQTIETSPPETLHELRKALKNLRYAFGHFAPLFDPKHACVFDEHLRRLQSTFGYLNDVATAQTLTKRLATAEIPVDVVSAIGFVLGWHTGRAQEVRQRLEAQWRDLAGTKIAQDLARA